MQKLPKIFFEEKIIFQVTADDISDHKVIGMVIKHYIRTIPKSLLEEKLFDSWMTLGADIVKSNSEGTKVPPHVLPGVIYNLQVGNFGYFWVEFKHPCTYGI